MFKKKIEEKLNEVLSSKNEFDELTQRGDLNKITAPLVALEDQLREQIQFDTSSQIETLIQKLKTDSEIDDTDLELIRLWIVGDAQGYVEMENNYKEWLSELNRLFSVIEGMKAEKLTLKNMYNLSGTVRDAVRVIGDIVFFKQQQDRLEKFENVSKNLNSKNKKILADILQRKLESNEM